MTADQFFDPISIIFWTGLALVILLQGVFVGRGIWPESRRWKLGFITLFGSTLGMVWLGGWNGYTWGFLVLANLWGRVLIQSTPLARLWLRREGPRWTAAYGFGFGWTLLMMISPYHPLDLITWAKLFVSLGIAGAVKEGWEAGRDAWQAQKLREAKPEAMNSNGSTD